MVTNITISDIPNAHIKYQKTDDTCHKISKTPKVPLTDKPKRGRKRKLSTGGDRDKYVCPTRCHFTQRLLAQTRDCLCTGYSGTRSVSCTELIVKCILCVMSAKMH